MKPDTIPQPSWLSAYLYYSEPWESFLCQAVAPFVEQIKLRQLAEEFFFIRYWEKGPHIRLRFKGNIRDLEKYVKPALIAHFTAYFSAHPSSRTQPPWLSQVPEAQQWLANNSIQWVAYEPETERYGGEAGLFIAEKQFQASSEAVLSILLESRTWEYNLALGAAIQLHLGFAFAACMNLPEARLFFSKVFENWLPRACISYGQNISTEERQAQENEVLQAFNRTYQKQKKVLLPFFQRIWTALESQAEFEQVWFNTWVYQMKGICTELQQIQNRGQLTIPAAYVIHPQAFISRQQRQLWVIYDSYVHMTNNRLGILNHDEGFLGYLIKQILEEMALETKT